jgi:F0F1-type ATP synthase assembly protein I
VSRDPRQRSSYTTGIEWSTRITTLGFELALPAALGYWLDVKLGTGPWLLIVGALLGFLAFMTHLLQIAKETSRSDGRKNLDRKDRNT